MNHQDTTEPDSMSEDVGQSRTLAALAATTVNENLPVIPSRRNHTNNSSRQHSDHLPTIPEASAEEEGKKLTMNDHTSSPILTAVHTVPTPPPGNTDESGLVIPQDLTFPHVDIGLGHGEQSVTTLFTPVNRYAKIWTHSSDRLPALSDGTLPPPPFEEGSNLFHYGVFDSFPPL